MRLRTTLVAVTSLALLSATQAAAQDAHYWTEQYGNRARLLSGAVIGSSRDLASVYYNPGAMSLVEDPELLLSANVYQYTHYALSVDDTRVSDLTQNRFGSPPSLFAGEAKLGFLGKTRFAYSVLTRYSGDIRLESATALRSVTDPIEEEFDEVAAGVRFEQKLSETWVGFTLSRRLSEHWGIGVSPYLTVRSQRFGNQVSVQTQDTTGNAGILFEASQTRFINWRLLAKIGASAVYGPWRFGATITTPSLRLFGDGTVAGSRSIAVQDGPGDIVALVEEDIRADYKAPLTLGAGVGYDWSRTSLSVALEYFSAVDSTTVMDPEAIADPVTGDTLDLRFIQAFDPVLNVAVGVQHVFSEKLEGYAGVRTVFSAKIDGSDPASLPLAAWDIYHISTGTTFDLGRSQFTLGGVFAYGRSEDSTPVLNPEGDPLVENTASLKYLRFTIILGFSVFFQ